MRHVLRAFALFSHHPFIDQPSNTPLPFLKKFHLLLVGPAGLCRASRIYFYSPVTTFILGLSLRLWSYVLFSFIGQLG